MENNNDKNTNRLGFILAAVAGILALGMTFIFLKQMGDRSSMSTTPTAGTALKRVMVAVRDLPSHHVLNPNADLKVITVPEDSEYQDFLRNCVSESHAGELQGRRVGAAVPANYPILYSNLTTITQLDDTFTDGFLKTVTLPRENFFSSHLTPGDRVDILVTAPKPAPEKVRPVAQVNNGNIGEVVAAAFEPLAQLANNDNREMATKVVLENAEVFMVGPLLAANREFIGLTGPENTEYTEVTFRLSQADAVMLTNYVNSNNTKISLLMRPRPPRQRPGDGGYPTATPTQPNGPAKTAPAAPGAKPAAPSAKPAAPGAKPAAPQGPTPVAPQSR